MIRGILLVAAVVCGVIATGLAFGWGFWFFDERTWRADGLGWLGWAVTLFIAAHLPWVTRFDRNYGG